MQTRNLIISILIVGIAFFAGWWIVTKRPAPAPTENDGTLNTPTTSFSPREVKKTDVSQKGDYYHIDAFYPETENKRINDMFASFIKEQSQQFFDDTGVAVLTAEQAEGLGLSADRQYSLSVDYTSTVSSIAYNYVFDISLDTGGAHPNHYNRTYSFTEDGEVIRLADLFKPNSDYLTVISKFVQAELMKRDFADKQWISDGAGPVADNYQNFVLKDDGIEFLFDPYQVAAYAAGAQTVTVPYANLKSVLKADYASI